MAFGAFSRCPKCEGTSFKMVENSPSGSAFKLTFVQCASCATVMGVMDYHNIGEMLKKRNKAIQKIARQLNVSVNLD